MSRDFIGLAASGGNSAVECQLPKLDVAGSIPVPRSNLINNLPRSADRSMTIGRRRMPSDPKRSPIWRFQSPERAHTHENHAKIRQTNSALERHPQR